MQQTAYTVDVTYLGREMVH